MQLVMLAQPAPGECPHKYKEVEVNIGLANLNASFFYSLAQEPSRIIAYRCFGQGYETNKNMD